MYTFEDPTTDVGDQAEIVLGDFTFGFTLTYTTGGDFDNLEVQITCTEAPATGSPDLILTWDDDLQSFETSCSSDDTCEGTLSLFYFNDNTSIGCSGSIEYGSFEDFEGTMVWFDATDSGS